MSTQALLKEVPLFAALNEEELKQIATIAVEKKAGPRELIVEQNTTGDDMYVIAQGAVEVFIEGMDDERVLVMLGKGQVVGEMALVDYGFRSASARATKDGCRYYVIHRNDFNTLCQKNYRIGYIVMKNLAVDLAFKLRHRNLTEM